MGLINGLLLLLLFWYWIFLLGYWFLLSNNNFCFFLFAFIVLFVYMANWFAARLMLINFLEVIFLLVFFSFLKLHDLLLVLEVVFVLIIKLFLAEVGLFVKKSFSKSMIFSLDSFSFTLSVTNIERLWTWDLSSCSLIFLDRAPFSSWDFN